MISIKDDRKYLHIGDFLGILLLSSTKREDFSAIQALKGPFYHCNVTFSILMPL